MADDREPAHATYIESDVLVSSDWLAAHIDDEALRLYECTTYLRYLPQGSDAPYDVESGYADYLEAHLPGAAFLDLQGALSDAASAPHLRFTIPPLEDLAAAFAAEGIGDDCRVVLYSRDKPQWATRVWWMLRAVGFDRAAVLDGGFEKWQREGRDLEGSERRYRYATLTPRPRPARFVDRDAVRAAMDDAEVSVVNALAEDLHRGENARYGRPGRIPGSVNVPAAALIDPESNTFVDADTAVRVFGAVGVDPSRASVLYCGGGIAATLDAFVLHRLGHERLAVYDASMSEWARDPSLPIETD
jgi:thiosulfate/3-mercaptopyruvate sulfurtransferase